MAQERNNTHKWLVGIALGILSITLFTTPYLNVTRTTLSSAENTMAFLKDSGSFNYTSEIIKNEIESRLPASVQQNIIERSLINKLIDLVITPQLLESISNPVVKVQIALLQRDTNNITLKDNKLELKLEPYKQSLLGYSASFNLPPGVQSSVTEFAHSLPNTITVVDGNKNPNSPVITAIKIKSYYTTLMQAAVVMWYVFAIALLVLIGLLYKDLRKLFRIYAKAFGVLGVVVLSLSYIAPPGLNLLVPNNLTEASGPEIAQLIGGLNTHFFVLTRAYGWWYLVVAVVSTILAWYFKTFGLHYVPKDIKQHFVAQYKKVFKRKA